MGIGAISFGGSAQGREPGSDGCPRSPRSGEDLLARSGFIDIERFEVPFSWEFADPATYARTLASTGPAYEAMQEVGEDEFIRTATELARAEMRDGLVLRAQIKVVGFAARKPTGQKETSK